MSQQLDDNPKQSDRPNEASTKGAIKNMMKNKNVGTSHKLKFASLMSNFSENISKTFSNEYGVDTNIYDDALK